MAIPLIGAAIPLLAKVGTAAKALIAGTKGALAAKGAAGGVGSAMKIGATAPGVYMGTGSRMATQKLVEAAATNPAFKGGIGKALFGNMDKGEVLGRLAPDIFFGGLATATTPGDIGDRLIAGGTQFLGGGLGGVALAKGAGRLGVGQKGQLFADMAGSVGGDFLGMGVGDTLMRGKDKLAGGQGLTPYERLSAEQQEQLAAQIQQQTLLGAGLVPGYQQQYG